MSLSASGHLFSLLQLILYPQTLEIIILAFLGSEYNIVYLIADVAMAT